MDSRSVILEDDVTHSGGDRIGSFESGIRRNDPKRGRILICDLCLTADTNQASDT